VSAIHNGIHKSPTIATPTNDARHPNAPASPVASGGAIAAPIELPTKSTPKPAPRSRGKSTLCTVCAAPGNDGDSASPSNSRKTKSPASVSASECAPAITLHTSTATTRPLRAPTRSSTAPERGVPTR